MERQVVDAHTKLCDCKHLFFFGKQIKSKCSIYRCHKLASLFRACPKSTERKFSAQSMNIRLL